MDRARHLIEQLHLLPHPEGGHYRETFRSDVEVSLDRGHRSSSTAIYFLLGQGEVSRWHRVLADEAWHWYEGAELELLTWMGPGHDLARHRLGPVDEDCRPQHVVPAGCWQAARSLGGYTLVGCTVAPGFDFADFSLIDPSLPEYHWLHRQADVRFTDG